MTKQLIKYLFHISLILLSIKFILFYIKGYKCYITKCDEGLIEIFFVISVMTGAVLLVAGGNVIMRYCFGEYDSFIKEKIDPTLEKIVNFFNRRNL